MTQYELMVIVDPTLGDTGIESTLGTLKGLITSNKGNIVKEDTWGEKTLAYKINGSTKGHYTLFDVELDGAALKELTKSINLTKGIWRIMFVKKGA